VSIHESSERAAASGPLLPSFDQLLAGVKVYDWLKDTGIVAINSNLVLEQVGIKSPYMDIDGILFSPRTGMFSDEDGIFSSS
jgi:hypothetical protein